MRVYSALGRDFIEAWAALWAGQVVEQALPGITGQTGAG